MPPIDLTNAGQVVLPQIPGDLVKPIDSTGAIDLKDVKTDSLPTKRPKLDDSTIKITSGFYLSRFILWAMAGFIALLMVYVLFKNFDASDNIKNIFNDSTVSKRYDSTFDKKIQLAKIYQDESKSNRDFTVQISQMILINVLLPVLTSILGYIFGITSPKKENT